MKLPREELATAQMNKKLREVKARYFVDLIRHPGVVMISQGSNYLRIYFDYNVDGADARSLPHILDGVPVRLIPYLTPTETE